MKYIHLFSIIFLINCGGGGGSSSSASSSSTSEITGMQGDISAIEPIDLD
tara:strand:+ start:455 stop:604 length:150 start_codon:yes stop_codon:yes gene_type:complete